MNRIKIAVILLLTSSSLFAQLDQTEKKLSNYVDDHNDEAIALTQGRDQY